MLINDRKESTCVEPIKSLVDEIKTWIHGSRTWMDRLEDSMCYPLFKLQGDGL